MHVGELVESILVSVQWDCWRFPIPHAKPLLKQSVAVVSHEHRDHWHPNLRRKDALLIPSGCKVPEEFAGLRNVVRVGSSPLSFGSLRFLSLNAVAVARVVGQFVPRPHSYWWIAEARVGSVKGSAMFVGDLNRFDVEVLKRFVERMASFGRRLDAILLPSYGGVAGHGSAGPTELARAVENLASWFRERYGLVGALPHPAVAFPCNFEAVRV